MSEEKLKVGIILYQMLLSGGTERQAIMLARELVRRGYAVTLYTFQYNKEKCYQELLNGMRVVVENDARKLSLCIDRDTDILNPHEQIPLRVAAYFRRRVKRIPSVLMINDLYLAQWSLARELSPIRFSLLRRCMQWFKDQYESRRFFAGGSDEIAVLNNGTRDMLEFYLGRKSTVVRSGLDISRFPFSARAFPQRRRVRLLCHALFFRHRRFEDAIRAVARLVKDGFDVELAISGSYTHKKDARVYHEELKHIAEELGIAERVSFKGEVRESELLRLYKESDIFLFPSHKQTWGLAVFEAMASGLPSWTADYSSQYGDLIGAGQKIQNLAEQGKLRFVYVSMSFLGKESVYAAEAGLCANEQGKFFEMHDAIFAAHDSKENNGKYNKDKLEILAKKISGLDNAKFNTCLEEDKYLSAVQQIAQESSKFAQGTPTFYVNGKQVSASWSEIEREIEKLTRLIKPESKFVLFGTERGRRINWVRTVVRRAERRAVRAGGDGARLVYLNRLSDYCYLLALKEEKS